MEEIVNGIVLRAVDYKDSDKIITLFTIEKGIITAGAKGVKKAGAKLKFAVEPFCFAEYVLAKKSNRYTVISAQYLDSFYNLRTNLKKYYVSGAIGEVMLAALRENDADTSMFSVFMEAVKDVNYGDAEKLALIKFLVRLFKISGYGIESELCAFCGKKINGRVFFNFQNANFSCEEHCLEGYKEITPLTYNAFIAAKNAAFSGDNDEFLTLSDDAQNKLIKFLLYYFNYKTDAVIKSEAFVLTV